MVSIAIEWMIEIVSILGSGQTSTIGKTLQMAIAYLLTLIILSGFGGVYALTLGRLKTNWVMPGILAGLILTTLTAILANWGGWGSNGSLIGISWLLITSLAWGLGLAWGINRYLRVVSHQIDLSRQHALGELAIGSLVLTGLAFSLGRLFIAKPKPVEIASDLITPEPTIPRPTPPPTSAGFEPVPGTRPEITPIQDFYRVDINLLPPGDQEFIDNNDSLVQRLQQQGGETDLPAGTYKLVVDGLVREPLSLSLSDLKAFPMVDQYATLECISNPVGGDLIGTTLFQGVALKDVLEKAGLKENVVNIKFIGVDGYSESLPLQTALHPETLLCYAMGNKPLTKDHGAPLRLYTPNRFGIKNPKWIIKIEAIDSDYQGYWQQRGWSQSAFVQTTSVIDTLQEDEVNQVKIGGIAFAGARGIQSVELRVDDGSWQPTELDRPLSTFTWVLWRTFLDLTPGKHVITVRAIDGEGEAQTGKSTSSHPSGATGYHSKEITIQG
jgi:DMSO/TMAO reductase YedYZ molybdopterin-dependent catalytic subunit